MIIARLCCCSNLAPSLAYYETWRARCDMCNCCCIYMYSIHVTHTNYDRLLTPIALLYLSGAWAVARANLSKRDTPPLVLHTM